MEDGAFYNVIGTIVNLTEHEFVRFYLATAFRLRLWQRRKATTARICFAHSHLLQIEDTTK